MSTLTFLGVKSAFSVADDHNKGYQSIVLIEDDKDKLLIDCGSDLRFALRDMHDFGRNISVTDITGIFITHMHSDHMGGCEYFGYKTFFGNHRATIYVPRGFGDNIGELLWQVLAPGMEHLNVSVQLDQQYVDMSGYPTLRTYFDVKEIVSHKAWQYKGVNILRDNQAYHRNICGCSIVPIQTRHVVSGRNLDMPSFGCFMTNIQTGKRTLFSGDVYDGVDNGLHDAYEDADQIFHDCETTPYKSGVHAHYSVLRELSPSVKSKMWLYHYNDGELPDAVADGFQGFVKRGQEFSLS